MAIGAIENVSSVPTSKVLVIQNVLQLHCETDEELDAWVTGLSVLRKVCEIETKQAPVKDQKTKSPVVEKNVPTEKSVGISPRGQNPVQESSGKKDQIIASLQAQLSASEAAVQQRDETISTLGKRLEHSLRMLKAVHGMYEQQQRVLTAQEAVITEMDAANQVVQ